MTKCEWCNQEKENDEIYGYQEDEDDKGNMIYHWICNDCYAELFYDGDKSKIEEAR